MVARRSRESAALHRLSHAALGRKLSTPDAERLTGPGFGALVTHQTDAAHGEHVPVLLMAVGEPRPCRELSAQRVPMPSRAGEQGGEARWFVTFDDRWSLANDHPTTVRRGVKASTGRADRQIWVVGLLAN